MLDPDKYAVLPFHFWSVVFFVFGCMIGSFLNVCIHRMPRGESIINPPSHCPHCGYSIPWYLNVPLITWLWLRGCCANCRAPISIRYFAVELLTGVAGLSVWLCFGDAAHPLNSLPLALAYCVVLAGFIVATFIDFEHFIIPDEITLGGTAVGFVTSFLVPALHATTDRKLALERSFVGILVGAGMVYAILRLGKLLFGRQKFSFPPDTKITFTETCVQMPEQELPYEDVFYRKSDAILLAAKTAQLQLKTEEPNPRIFENASVRLAPTTLEIAGEKFDPETVARLDVVTEEIVIPREAMGLGDVKFMAAIGAFLGWEGAVFSLMASAIIGSIVGLTLVLLRRRDMSSRIPYGPYIALAAVLWLFKHDAILRWLVG